MTLPTTTVHNPRQATNSENWAEEWKAMRQTAMANYRQQALELKYQDAEPKVQARHQEAWAFLVTAIRSLETASQLHAQTIRGRL